MSKKKIQAKITNEATNEIFDTSDLEDNNKNENDFDFDSIDLDDIDNIQPYDNSKETYNYNYDREDKKDNTNKRVIPELHINSVQQQSEHIGYDSFKLKFSLIHADEANFSVDRHAFFRNKKPHIPATKDETIKMLYHPDHPYRQIVLTDDERRKIDSSDYEKLPHELARLRFPNAKPFYNTENHRLGLGHMYFYNGDFIVSFTGKIVSSNGNLGLITIDNIDQAIDVIKRTGLVTFGNAVFRNRAEVLSVHITNDITVPDINSYVKAFSSFLPMRTDRYCVLKYENSGYEILARGKQSKQTPNYQFCIYNKGAEINAHHQSGYIKCIGTTGMALANNTLRLELKLNNFPAIRKFLAPERKNGTLTLNEVLSCRQTPVIEMLRLLNITADNLRDARGKYITIAKEDKHPTQAEFERMLGLVKMLELHDYDLDRVRAYVETETQRRTSSNYFQEKRDILQRYITCYMPQTVATLLELLSAMSY